MIITDQIEVALENIAILEKQIANLKETTYQIKSCVLTLSDDEGRCIGRPEPEHYPGELFGDGLWEYTGEFRKAEPLEHFVLFSTFLVTRDGTAGETDFEYWILCPVIQKSKSLEK